MPVQKGRKSAPRLTIKYLVVPQDLQVARIGCKMLPELLAVQNLVFNLTFSGVDDRFLQIVEQER